MLAVYNGSSVLWTKRAGMTTGNWNCMRSSEFGYRRDFVCLSRHCGFHNDGIGRLPSHCSFHNDGTGRLPRHCSFHNDGTGRLPRHCDFDKQVWHRASSWTGYTGNGMRLCLTEYTKKSVPQHRNFTLFTGFMLLFIYLLLYLRSNIKRMIIYEEVTVNGLWTISKI